MENSKPLATESFSYTWSIDHKKPPPPTIEKHHNFDFDVPPNTVFSDLIHADEIFSDGHIKPVYIDRSKVYKTLKTSTSLLASPISPYPSRSSTNTNQKWKKSTKKILQKCFGFVKPLCERIESSRRNGQVDDLNQKVFELDQWIDVKKNIGYGCEENVKINWRSSPNISPIHSSNNVWYDAENSINEAILYCKRSIENQDDKNIKKGESAKRDSRSNALQKFYHNACTYK